MTAYMQTKKELISLGFEKCREKGWFKKAIDDEYYAAVCFEKMNNFGVEAKPDYYVQTYKPHFDIRVTIGSEGFFHLCSVNQIVGLWGKKERIAGYILDEDTVVRELLEDFKREFYAPLFLEPKIDSLYDFMCQLQIKNHGFVAYNSYELAYAAYREKRYDEAMFCLKAIFYINMYDEKILTLPTKREYLLDRELESEITPELIERLRAVKKSSFADWIGIEGVFDLYDDIQKKLC